MVTGVLPNACRTLSQGRDQTLTGVLERLLSHNFTLPEAALRKGLVYMGTATRLRRTVWDMMQGKKEVKIGVIGGRCKSEI